MLREANIDADPCTNQLRKDTKRFMRLTIDDDEVHLMMSTRDQPTEASDAS